ncbi:MAG: NAD(P)-binding domain-containing protein [Myxococcota bacterium]|nr:NAD(P)-binding domain-containing protein [Myxococcota bacterium]
MLEAAIYLLPLLLALGLWWHKRSRFEARSKLAFEASRASGLDEPVSLHPVINRNRCMGCAACVEACLQGDVLGVIAGQAELVNPTHCIGHGACREACPTDAIELAIGSETRGVDIPILGPDFQSNVPGVFVAGELGGMGLIRNAVEQGRRAMESVRKIEGVGQDDDLLDVVIVGCGPAGLSASLAAKEHGLRFVTLEQDTLGGSINHHARGKIVVTEPVKMPLVGDVRIRETTKESLLALWEKIVAETGLEIRERERVDGLRVRERDFEVVTTRGRHFTRAVVLAVGRRGSPRMLEVPGEDSSKVVYRLVDPQQYEGKRVLVVGGGDSALEAAVALSKVPGADVTLAHRGEAFVRARPESREKLLAAEARGALKVRMGSRVTEITPDAVTLDSEGRRDQIPNDAVVACTGGILPKDFLRSIGVRVETRFGTPLHS